MQDWDKVRRTLGPNRTYFDVEDPANKGTTIPVVDLLRRYPPPASLPPRRDILGELLKRDTWTRREALLILSGYQPDCQTDNSGGIPAVVEPRYLDGTDYFLLNVEQVSNPREQVAMLEYVRLNEYAKGGNPEERRTPEEWIEWAEGKGFTPYWVPEVKNASDPEKEAARKAKGRYTLREAAKEIARNARGNERDVLHELKAAWGSGTLAAYRPGGEFPVRPKSSSLHPDYLEAYAADLNAWLAKNTPRITWRFEEPEQGSTPGDVSAPDADAERMEGGAKEISAVPLQIVKAAPWPRPNGYTPESFHRDLSDPPKWMQTARISKGKPGRKQQSSTWNPALLAECLATNKGMSRHTLRRLLESSFPDFLEQWDAMPPP